jgi:hypothetical protein
VTEEYRWPYVHPLLLPLTCWIDWRRSRMRWEFRRDLQGMIGDDSVIDRMRHGKLADLPRACYGRHGS